MKFINFLSGKKTHIVGLLMVATGILQGDNQMIMEGLGFIFIRLSIAKNDISTK